jgi:hypothetical protein
VPSDRCFSHLLDLLTNPPVRAFQPRENGSVPLNRVWGHYIPGCSIVNSRIQDHRACRTIRWHMAKPIKLDTDTAQDNVFRWLTDGRNDNERLPLCENPINERFATRLSAIYSCTQSRVKGVFVQPAQCDIICFDWLITYIRESRSRDRCSRARHKDRDCAGEVCE